MSIIEKAQRLPVREIGPAIVFEVEGDHENYHVTIGERFADCSCPAGVAQRLCSHLIAARLHQIEEGHGL